MKNITASHDYLAEVDPAAIKEIFPFKQRRAAITPEISVVVATHNRSHLIIRALEALTRQDLSTDLFEIIIVSDGSTDGTEKIIKNFIEKCPSPNVILIALKENRGSSFARNVGIIKAGAELIAITDDDCIVPYGWLSNFLRAFETHTDCIAVGGFKKPYRNNGKLPSRYDTFMFWRRFPNMKNEYKSVEMSPFNNCGDTANVCYKKQALINAGGFNHGLKTFNDWELKARLHQLGKPLLYVPLFVPHEADLTFSRFFQYWLRLGHDCFLISKIHPAPVFNTSLRVSFRRAAFGINNVIKAQRDEIFKKTPSAILLFIFLEAVINICLWLGKYVMPIRFPV